MLKAQALFLLSVIAASYGLLVIAVLAAGYFGSSFCELCFQSFFCIAHSALIAFFIERCRLFQKPLLPLVRSRLSFFGLLLLILLATFFILFIDTYFPHQPFLIVLALVVIWAVIIYPFDLCIERRRNSF